MTAVTIEYTGKTFTLTDEHYACSYGQPVLVGPDGTTYGPYEDAVVRGNWSTTARGVASYIRDDRPDDDEALEFLRKFEAIPAPAGF